MKTIGLYGYYSQGNFGDDLMAVMTVVYLSNHGYKCLVYGLRQSDKSDFHVNTTHDLDELVNNSDAVVLAGGGLYITHRSPWPPVVDAYQQLGILLAKCQQLRKPIFGLSLGGSGTASLPHWQNSAITFTKQAKWISVRNKEDLIIANAYQATFSHFPDIVWCCSRFFPGNTSLKKVIRIGVYSAYAENRIDKFLIYTLLRSLSRLKGIEIIIIDSPSVHDKLVQKILSRQRISLHMMSALREDTALISSLDYVITSRLHVGISCMSYGGGMIALLPEHKAVLALSDSLLASNIISSRFHILFILFQMLFAKDSNFVLKKFQKIRPDICLNRSNGGMLHFSSLLSQLNLYVRGSK